MPTPIDAPISSVSDTARCVAVYRARESSRPDALFRDPYAEELAGARGRAIAELMPRSARNGWPLIARTRLIDDLIRDAIARGCDCVLNLAAAQPRCRLRRVAVNLTDAAARTAMLRDAVGSSMQVLVITEGLQSILHAAAHFRRLPWPLRLFALLPSPDPRCPGRRPWSGVAMLGRPAPGLNSG